MGSSFIGSYGTHMSFTFKIRATNLPVMDKGLEGSSADPYFKMYVDGEKVYQSDKIKNTLNPEWDTFELDRETFGGTPKITDIKLKLKDSDWGNDDDAIGKCYFKIMNHDGPIGKHRAVELVNDDGDACGNVYIEVDEN